MSSTANDVCAKCSKSLDITIDPMSDDDEDNDTSMGDPATNHHTVPDDVHLSCGDHFHWECLLSAYELSRCPSCDADITTSSAPGSSRQASAPQQQQQPTRILVNLTNEGGLQSGIDIFPLLQEESYLRAYPEERKSRAFLEFCREGDHRAIVELLQSCNEDDDDDDDDDQMHDDDDDDEEHDQNGPAKTADEILRYQDPIGDMQSGLHAAAANGHREVAWLLLLLASTYPELEFPALVFQEAASMGVMREEQEGKVDIRSLRDAQGRTAEDMARQAGVVWNGWIGNGRLALP